MFFLKSSNFHKPKKLIHLFVLLILLVYCTKERNNPWDDKNTLKKDTWMVDNLTIDIFKIDSINLAWELKNDKIEGVRIDRKIDEQPWVTNYAQIPNNILNFTDTAVNLLNHKYHYRLYAYAGNNLSSFLDTIVPKLNLPTINTTSITSLTSTSAVSGGNITNDGGSTITQRGVCWSTTPNPTILNDKTINGVGKGSFTSNLTGLSAATNYYLRAYATNIAGTSYGAEVSFTTRQILPVLTTNLITSITSTSAVSGGNISNEGEDTVIQRGVCWSTSPNPIVSNNKTTDGNGIGSFSSNLDGLSAGTTYYVRAYVTNSTGTFYGNELIFSSLVALSGDGVIDINGNIYQSVIIGNQEWMAQNLNVSEYNDGTNIPNVTDNSQWLNLNTGAWCYYNHNSTNESTYGKLYNWYAVNTGKLCPNGWHVPTDAEWTKLTDNLGGTSVAGGKMKSTEPQYWQSPNSNATNESGFSGLPGGFRINGGNFDLDGTSGFWWSSSENRSIYAWYRDLYYNFGKVSRGDYNKEGGMSVRCIKD